ncbi:MAG: hypothetical protein MZV64_17685 [Ignavibacteriales bacterium]|nr:hypothetical protein [Ignavibacteriales bacterium]
MHWPNSNGSPSPSRANGVFPRRSSRLRRTKRAQAKGTRSRAAEGPGNCRAGQGSDRKRGRGSATIEAVKGYLNVYFKTSDYARRTVDEVLASASDFGRGASKNETRDGRICPAEHASLVPHRALPQHDPGRGAGAAGGVCRL